MVREQTALNHNEEVILDLRPHWWFFSRQVMALIASILVGIVALALGWPSAVAMAVGVAIIGSLIWLGLRYIVWTTTNFVVTTDRLIVRSGVLSREGTEIPLERVNTVFFRQSLFERMIGSGDLTIESAGEMGNQDFTDIRRPLNVQNEIYRQMENNENRKFDRVSSGMTNQGIGQASIPKQIEELDALRQKGLITQAEFDAKKAELLGRL